MRDSHPCPHRALLRAHEHEAREFSPDGEVVAQDVDLDGITKRRTSHQPDSNAWSEPHLDEPSPGQSCSVDPHNQPDFAGYQIIQ